MRIEEPTYSPPRFTYRALASRVLAVAVPGAVGDWAVYIDAVAGERHDAEVQEVAKQGVKQSRALACLLFPYFDPAKYRD